MTDDLDQSLGSDVSSDPASLQATIAEALGSEFELLRPLGSGRTAHVFLARETALRRLVAVKLLRPEVGEDRGIRARFEREAHSVAAIRHDRIPAVYRVGRLPTGLPFMMLQYVEGRTLRDRLEATGAIGVGEARRILADLAGALAASHAHGVIHRHVSPESVMLEHGTERAFLTDFGAAALRESGAESGQRITRVGENPGDPRYSSPEQLRGEKVTPQADVYSLGVLGYEILTQSDPFGSGSPSELMAAHLQSEPRELPWSIVGLHPELGQILHRCLHKEPSRRPTADDVQRALSDGAEADGSSGAGDSLLSASPGLAGFVAELRRRRVYQVVAAYGVAVVAALGIGNDLIAGWPEFEWLYRIFVALTLGSFPIVVVLAWIYNVTRSGLKRTEPSPGTTPGKAIRIVALTAVALLAGVAGWLLLR